MESNCKLVCCSWTGPPRKIRALTPSATSPQPAASTLEGEGGVKKAELEPVAEASATTNITTLAPAANTKETQEFVVE